MNYDLDAEQVTLENIHHLHENDLKPDEVAANAQIMHRIHQTIINNPMIQKQLRSKN